MCTDTNRVIVLDDDADLGRLLRKILEGERQKTARLARLTHDVKTPLTSIKLLSQLVRKRAEDGTLDLPRLQDELQRIEVLASRAAALLTNLMQAARQEIGLPLRPVKAPCDLLELCRQLVLEHQSTTDRHVLRLVSRQRSIVGSWDAAALTSVIDNLLSNAIKYSPKGGDVVLDVRSVRIGGARWVVLCVQDMGQGIPAADLPHVFDPFFRAGSAGGAAGTGIGLATVKEVVEAHGGEVEVRSQPGAGSTFTVRLPCDEPGAASRA